MSKDTTPTQEEMDKANEFLAKCREEMRKFLPNYKTHPPQKEGKKNRQKG